MPPRIGSMTHERHPGAYNNPRRCAAREAAAMRLLDMQGQRDLPTQCGS
ncbi:unnamed protein product [Mycetohabitans rhizoxinica HKI 454]|uniref:Uncharacterized protein n=1 Tax=Mycetohabitans rhizoxinica (strain DSM 19002 / CIP 109453 / HKI 454) TaxID=882378 RepID=E5AL25_MYCRK|nr:unnamed protein product [Mycetohabitans rhizoxinica HKI 454]